jgi:hypothetical protein
MNGKTGRPITIGGIRSMSRYELERARQERHERARQTVALLATVLLLLALARAMAA